MQTLLIVSELIARSLPLVAIAASLMESNPRNQMRALLIAPPATFICALVGLVAFFSAGQPTLTFPIAPHVDLRIDAISAAMTASIAFIASVVVWFSERNLLGSQTRVSFIQHLVAVAWVASMLVASDNMILMLICWTGISFLLWRLVGLEKVAAASARRVLTIHLFSDVCLLLAVALTVFCCHTVEFSQLAASTSALQAPAVVFGHMLPCKAGTLVGLLLVLAMFSKSALFPFHRWLLATIDAPTPLSGLLHAGVVNVSAVLAARFLPVLAISTFVLVVWAVWAAVCAIVATLIMSARSDTKGELVFSTVGQMAFMLLECLMAAVLYSVDPHSAGVFIAAAVFHLIAHGCFKCMMFLQSHSSISEGQLKMRYGYAMEGTSQWQSRVRLALLGTLAVPVCYLLLREASVDSQISLSVLITAIALSAAVPVMKSVKLNLLLPAGVGFLSLVMLSGFISEKFEGSGASHQLHDSWIMTVCLIAFATVGFGVSWLRSSHFGKWLYVHILNGLYIEDMGDALYGAFVRVTSVFEKKRRCQP